MDPNGLGVPVASASWHSGSSPYAGGSGLDISGHFGDGQNTHLAYAGNPLAGTDPSGLFVGLIAAFAPGPSDYIRGALTELTTQYASNLEWDVDWATDWSMPDDWYSRLDSKWVVLAIGRGVKNAFDIDIPFTDEKINPLDVFASAAGAGRAKAGKAYQRIARDAASIGSHASAIVSRLKVDPTAIPGSWGRGKLAKVMHKIGAKVDKGRESGTTIYTLGNGAQIRVMPKPSRSYPNMDPQKTVGDYYYRSRQNEGAAWGPPVGLRGAP